MRMQNELIALKERELSLKRRLLTKTTTQIDQVLPAQNVVDTPNNPNPEQPEVATTAADEPAVDKPVAQLRTTQIPNRNTEELLDYIANLQDQCEKCETNLNVITKKYRQESLEKNRLLTVDQQLQDFRQALASTEDEKDAILQKQADEIVTLKVAQHMDQKRREYVEEDLHAQRCNAKLAKEQSNRLLYSLRRQLIEFSNQANIPPIPRPRASQQRSPDEELMREVALLKYKLGCVVRDQLKSIVDNDEATTHYNSLAVVQDDFAVEFVTRHEFETMQNDCRRLQTLNAEHSAIVKRLEETLRLSERQVKMYQQTFGQQSEEEIALRHLIVDLQSESNEKYILAKTGRELQRCQAAEESLKETIVHQQVEIEMLKKEVENCELKADELALEMKLERDNDDLKMR